MTAKFKTKRSLNGGAVPAADVTEYGVHYVNIADKRVGIHDEFGDPIDLVAVTHFSERGVYEVADLIEFSGSIFSAIVANGPGVFDPTEWRSISTVIGTGLTFNYRWSTDKTGLLIGPGQVGVNSAFPLPDPPTTITFFAHETTSGGNDISIFWDSVTVGDYVGFVEIGTDSENVTIQVTAAPTKALGIYSIVGNVIASSATEPESDRRGTLSILADPVSRIPPGGATDSVLTKDSNSNYDMSWRTELDAGSY